MKRNKRNLIANVILIVLFSILIFSFWQNPVLAAGDNVIKEVGAELYNAIFLMISWILWIPAWALGSLSLGIIYLLLQVAQFNKFINVPSVTTAWLIVRDICNMFFIIVLLLMAFGTVLGQEAWNYRRLLGKLVIAAVMINFSKMICGLLIDAGQIVMITFVNAFKDSAAGVLINATGLSTMWNISKDNGLSLANFSIAGTMILNLIFVIISFVVLLAFFLILLIRVVMLWLLVVLSPIIWMGNLVPAFSGYVSQWWKQFTNWVIIGPILAFFLWFSLLILQSDIAGDFGVKGVNEEGVITTTLSELSESKNILNYAFAITILITSLGVATKLGGRASGAIVGWASGKSGYSPMKWLRKTAQEAPKALGWGAPGKAIGEKLSETKGLRFLTAQGRTAMTKEKEEAAMMRQGVSGAYEKSVNRRSKECEEEGLFRDVDEIKDNFKQAVKKRDWVTAETFGRQLNKEKKLGMEELNLLKEGTGLAGKDQQTAYSVLAKLTSGASDYNKAVSVIAPKWENKKYRAKKEIPETPGEKSEREEALEKAETAAGKIAGADMGKAIAGMNNADKYEEEARFYLGLDEKQFFRMPEKTKEQIMGQLEKVANQAKYKTDLRNKANKKIATLTRPAKTANKTQGENYSFLDPSKLNESAAASEIEKIKNSLRSKKDINGKPLSSVVEIELNKYLKELEKRANDFKTSA
ncbi:MAG: Uncharacterized protein Athens101410_109 [Parcubacteria group bacterium Athens1014_10]|nr:MAG: Uncharacterized protein Athens101410_109 [Parcubacteria group bacterium Athens1014_10]TSD05922.1 MAG: Uncharacterized protein Athens071412_204 [Parcubacteria group bacterium Athens0714_12]